MNLGSPDSTEVKDVRTYLKEFLMDKRVLDTPYLLRTLLVNLIIVPFRAPKSAHAYESIWTKEGSPLIMLTQQLQTALKQEIDMPVYMAMRYGNPGVKSVFDIIAKEHPEITDVTLLPLYPHYAMSSYETAVVQAQELHKKGKYRFAIETIKPFYNEPHYIHALSESIKPYLEQDYDHILFSYHGIPERHVQKTDMTGQHCLKVNDCCNVPSQAHTQCYRHQCFNTTELVAQQLNIPKEKYSNSFQSRLGRDEWLKPYTVVRLAELPKEGIKKLLILCPAFVSDCLETLEEIAIEGNVVFTAAGGESFTLIPCLNVHPLWVTTIAQWMKELSKGSKEMLLKQMY